MLYALKRPVGFGNVISRELEENMKRRANCNFPKTDVMEIGDDIKVFVEMPGIGREDISLNVNEDNVLTIKGSKDENSLYEGKTLHRRERRECDYVRYINLPDDIDKEKISAKYNNGLLELNIPKQEPKLPKEIEISVD
jgi:HSP20 family protein